MNIEIEEKTNTTSVDSQTNKPQPLTAMTASTGATRDTENPEFTWDKEMAPAPQTRTLCRLGAKTGKVFRTVRGGIRRLEIGMEAILLDTATKLEGFIREHFEVTVIKGGKVKGNAIPAADLNVLLASPALQTELPVVDCVTTTVTYNSRWEITRPGYNDGPEGERYFYTGETVVPARKPRRIREFLGAMFFKSEADRTNALALALTVMLRFMWPGKKPFGAITANKSQAGKDTVADFSAGSTGHVEISWHAADWALQNEAVSALTDPSVGLLTIGNIRSGSSVIESAFIERIVTSPKALMQSSKRYGDGFQRNGDFVVAATANHGRFSSDSANRSLPIHLEQVGDINARVSPIGDPRHEFLPLHRQEIEAELCGLIENWKDAGCPLDQGVKHPMTEWARTVGGILKANGFTDFLGNWSFQRSVNDSIREALAIIAYATLSDAWLRVSDIVKVAVNQGVVGVLMDSRHRESDRSIERQLGVLLTAYREEPLHLETDSGVLTYIIRKARNAQVGGQTATVYKFEKQSNSQSGEGA